MTQGLTPHVETTRKHGPNDQGTFIAFPSLDGAWTMKTVILAVVIAVAIPATVLAQDEPQGTLSLATNPAVMVYIDGQRVGLSPVLNHGLAAGEHRVTLLLVRPDG